MSFLAGGGQYIPPWVQQAGQDALGGAVRGAVNRYLPQAQSTATGGMQIPVGSNIDILSQDEARAAGLLPRKRRRRRRLLTCSDKADIAFLHGQLGGGQLGRAAISALLSRRCG